MPLNDGDICDLGLGDPCASGQCQQGACQPQPAPDGTPCNDKLFCTINDHCVAGACTGDPNPCAPPDNPCLVGVCNEFSFSCTTTPGNEGNASARDS